MLNPSNLRDAIPRGTLSSPQAFDSATEHLLLSRKAIDSTLIAGGLLHMEQAFARIARGTQIELSVYFNFTIQRIILNAPAGTLLHGEDSRLEIFSSMGSTESTASVHLAGHHADFSKHAWNRTALDASLDSFPLIFAAMERIKLIALTLDGRPSASQTFNFAVEEANFSMLARLFGCHEQLAFAEAVIIDGSSISANSPRRAAAL